MKKTIARVSAICLALLALIATGLRAGGVSAQSDTQLQVNRTNLEVTAGPIFTPDENVVLWYNLPDGSAAYLTQATALDSGALDFMIDPDIWASIPGGATTLVAHGDTSDMEAIYTFTQPAPVALSIDMSTMTATAGAAFTSYEPITVWYNLPDGSAVYLTRIDALVDGSLNWTIDADTWANVPGNATSLVAHGDFSGTNAVYVFAH